MNQESQAMFPTSLKVIAVLLLCAVCFVGGRFARVWGSHVSEKEQMQQLIEDSDQFESVVNDLVEAIRTDLDTFVTQSKPAIPKDYIGVIKGQLEPGFYWGTKSNPFRKQFESAYTLEHLEGLASASPSVSFPRLTIHYDSETIDSLISKENASLDNATQELFKKIYWGKGFSRENLFPNLETYLNSDSRFKLIPLSTQNMRQKSGKKEVIRAEFSNSFILKSNSETLPEGIFLQVDAEIDMEENRLEFKFQFNEFSLK